MTSTYEALQQELLEKDIVFTISARALTPIFIGGYDGRCKHPGGLGFEGLREPSIKGVWRWWARALIAAAIRKAEGVYIDIETADSIVSRILGGSSRRSHEKVSSKYTIIVSKISTNDYTSIEDYGDNPRVKLIHMGSEGKERRRRLEPDYVIKPGTNITITVLRNRSTRQVEDKFALWSLVLSLILDGVGKITSRGFGKLKITKVEGDNTSELDSILQELYSSQTVNAVKENLKKLIDKAIEKAQNFIAGVNEEEIIRCAKRYEKPLMEIPLISEELMMLGIPSKTFTTTKQALLVIGNASLKMYHKMLLLLRRKEKEKEKVHDVNQVRREAQRISGKDAHTWILGLPRSQEPAIVHNGKEKEREIRKKLSRELRSRFENYEKLVKKVKEVEIRGQRRIRIPTGYYYLGVNKEELELRRRSPIRFTLIEAHGSKYFVVIYGFKVFDLENILNGLVHVGVHYERKREGRRVKVINVKRFDVTSITDILRKEGKSLESMIVDIINSVKELIEKSIVEGTRRARSGRPGR